MNPNGKSTWESNGKNYLVRVLSNYTPHAIVGAMAAVFESSGLGEIATELGELIGYLDRAASTS